MLIVVNDGQAGACMLPVHPDRAARRPRRAGGLVALDHRCRSKPMIKDVMVRLDGTKADEVRLAAVDAIAELFEAQIIGLYLNVLPVIFVEEGDGVGAIRAAEALKKAKAIGDKVETVLRNRLARLQKPVEIRRHDVISDAGVDIATREARVADTFVALRPNGAPLEPEDLLESILFGSGRHLFLVPHENSARTAFDRVLVAWNGSREAARAMAEAMPYLQKAKEVAVLIVDDSSVAVSPTRLGRDAVNHLKHHGVNASLIQTKPQDGDVGATLIAEAKRLKADLIVMGGYGHSRLREWLLGGATYRLLHEAPVPLLLAH
jgi:nucleotide-binding universal stress UspA family protein